MKSDAPRRLVFIFYKFSVFEEQPDEYLHLDNGQIEIWSVSMSFMQMETYLLNVALSRRFAVFHIVLSRNLSYTIEWKLANKYEKPLRRMCDPLSVDHMWTISTIC